MSSSDSNSAVRLSTLDPARRAALEIRFAAAVVFRSGAIAAATESEFKTHKKS